MTEDEPIYHVERANASPEIGQLPVNMATNTPANPMELLSFAVQKDLDVEKMQVLMEMEKEWRGEKAKSAYNEAIAKFAGMKEPIRKNTTGAGPGGSKFNYSDYAQIVDTITPWLKKCGLSFDHRKDAPVIDNGRITMQMVYCQIRHKEGHLEEFSFPAMVDYRLDGKLSPVQLLQAAITYAKRQSLCDGLGLSTSDEVSADADATAPAPRTPQAKQQPASNGSPGACNANQVKMMATAAKNKGLDEKVVCSTATGDPKIAAFDQVPFGKLNDVLDFIRMQG